MLCHPQINHNMITLFFNFLSKQSYEKDGSGDAEALTSTVPPHYTSFASVLNLARLLKIPHQLMQSQIALKAAKQCQAEAAISICKYGVKWNQAISYFV